MWPKEQLLINVLHSIAKIQSMMDFNMDLRQWLIILSIKSLLVVLKKSAIIQH